MKAMIFAAGLGTRLLPLTKNKPKALVEVNGKPLLQILLEKLIDSGIREVIINVHHCPGQIIDFLDRNNQSGIRIAVSDETGQLLDTGGGLKKASWFFDDGNPFLVHNVDVISDLDFNEMLRYHLAARALATVAVRSRTTSRYLLFDEDMRLGGWENVKTGEKILTEKHNKLTRFAFSGIHIIDPAFLSLISETGKFSIVDTYLRLSESEIIKGYVHDQTAWCDVGKPHDLDRLNLDFESDSEK